MAGRRDHKPMRAAGLRTPAGPRSSTPSSSSPQRRCFFKKAIRATSGGTGGRMVVRRVRPFVSEGKCPLWDTQHTASRRQAGRRGLSLGRGRRGDVALAEVAGAQRGVALGGRAVAAAAREADLD